MAEEKLWTHRVCVSFARELARRGHAVLRFDYRGNGDSEGDFAEWSVEGALADIRSAMAVVRERSGQSSLSLLGLRAGATLAARLADDASEVERLVLWAPIIDGGAYMQEQLRVNLATQLAVHKEVREDRTALVARLGRGETVNIDGYPLTLTLYQQMSALKLAAAPHVFAGRCLIAAVTRQAVDRVPPDIDRLAHLYPHATAIAVQEESFWKEIAEFYEAAPRLAAATLAWLEAA
jgi:exosortase A-associated hydrolase 2